MNIAVVGIGYVGLANAILLAQNHNVIAVDTVQTKVDMVNSRRSPLVDTEIEDYLSNKPLRLTATMDSESAYRAVELVMVKSFPRFLYHSV